MPCRAFGVFFIAYAVSLFLIAVSPVCAQDAPDVQAAPRIDPLLAAEQALTFQDGGGTAAPGGAASRSSTGAILRLVLTLALAAAAIYGVTYFIKRASRRGETQDPFLKVLASTALGPGRNVHVVAAGSKAWLLGAAEGGVSLICEIEDRDLLNAMFLEDSRRGADATVPGRTLDFKAMLRRLGMPVQDSVPGAENIRKRRERLKGL